MIMISKLRIFVNCPLINEKPGEIGSAGRVVLGARPGNNGRYRCLGVQMPRFLCGFVSMKKAISSTGTQIEQDVTSFSFKMQSAIVDVEPSFP